MLEQLVGQVLDNKYRIDKKLGQGGMGAVFLAVHLGTARPVALKVISPRFMANEEFVSRFQREAKAAGLLRHPNIVNVTDFGFAQVGPTRIAYLVMEYLDGCPLSDILKEEQQLPLNWVVEIVEQVCLAIDKAHQYGIVHRDLKPDNIWLEPNERGGYRVKVLDFGLAKVVTAPTPEAAQSTAELVSTDSITLILDSGPLQPTLALGGQPERPAPRAATGQATEVIGSHRGGPPGDEAATEVIGGPADADAPGQRAADPKTVVAARMTARLAGELTVAGTVLGTPVYMSPEQCRGDKLDARSDIYSLGVIAYEMLAGQPPFTGKMQELLTAHMQTPPPPLRERRPDLPAAAEALLMSALAKDPAARPPGAAALANGLRARTAGAGVLLHKAFNLYSENFPVFLRVSLLANLPLVAALVIWVIGQLLDRWAPAAAFITDTVVGFLDHASEPIAWLICVGVFVPVVARLIIAPLRPLHIGQVFRALKKRLRPFVVATLLFDALVMFLLLYEDFVLGLAGGVFRETSFSNRLLMPFITAATGMLPDPMLLRAVVAMLFALPAYWALRAALNYLLYAPVIVMEERSALQAFARSKELMAGARVTALKILTVFLAIRLLDGALATLIEGQLMKGQEMMFKAILLGAASRATTAALDTLLDPLIVVALALLYFRTRQAAGETMQEILGDYQEGEIPRTRWQERMLKRLSVRISRASKA